MKQKVGPVVRTFVMFLACLIGSSAFSALASTTWTAPSVPPPGGNVDAPLNVGSTAQTKAGGSIQINGSFGIAGGQFVYLPTGVTPTAGQALVADGSSPGKVVWGSPIGMSSGSSSAGYWYQVGTLLIEGGISYPGNLKRTTVAFPKPFQSIASVQVTPLNSGNAYGQVHPEQQVMVANIGNSSFDFQTINNNGGSWVALGTGF